MKNLRRVLGLLSLISVIVFLSTENPVIGGFAVATVIADILAHEYHMRNRNVMTD